MLAKKGQSFLLVYFLLITVIILVGALGVMLVAEIRTRIQEREGLAALYLAQAGVERAKVELRYSSWPGISNVILGGGTYSVACTFQKDYLNTYTIESTGNYKRAEKKINLIISSGPPYQPVSWTWRQPEG